jgi:hypothetical protein
MKMTLLILIAILTGLIVLPVALAKHSTIIDPMLDYLTNRWLSEVRDYLPKEQWARDLVRSNISKDINNYRRVSRSPRKVHVSKTVDNQNYVIQITSLDGKITSLWLDADENVRSITSY